jgi:hypothetical protein
MVKRDGRCGAGYLINPALCPAPYALDLASASDALMRVISPGPGPLGRKQA